MREKGARPQEAGNSKVTMFSSEYPPCWGGVGRHVQSLCRQLHEHLDLRLVTATYGQPFEQFRVTNLARVRVRSFPLLLAQYLAGVTLRHYDASELVHLHVPHVFLPARDRRIVSTFHVVWAEYSKALGQEHPISLFDVKLPSLNRKLIAAERELARRSDAVIAVSRSVKNQLVSTYDIPAEKVYVIHNGVNVGQFRPSLSRAKLVLYVGRHTAHKGLPYLLQAFAELARSHKDYRLMLIGERLEGGVDTSLIRLSKKLGILDRVQFAGRLQEEDARRIIGRAECLVLPSLAESFGMAVLEAMASETPVVATNVGGIPEIVKHDFNGLLVPPSSSDALATSIDRIVSNPKLRVRLAREGRNTCQQFSWERTAAQTLRVYDRVCS